MDTKAKLAIFGVAAWLLFSRKAGATTARVGGSMTSVPVRAISQSTQPWGSTLVGNSTDPNNTCARVGCVVTSMAMVANSLRGMNFVPSDLRPGGVAGLTSANYSGAAMIFESSGRALGVDAFESSRIRQVQRTAANITKMKQLIDATLLQKGLAVLRVDYDLSTPADNHSVVCFAKNANGTYQCADPAGGVFITLDGNLFVQRTSTKKYFVNGVSPVFRAGRGSQPVV